MTSQRRAGAIAAAALFALGACGPEPARDYGHSLFSDPSVSSAGSNVFRCSTCHEIGPTPTTLAAGYTLYDATARASWWGGFETTLLDAMNQCVTNFMRGTELSAQDDKARGLYAYLQSVSPDASAPMLPLTVVQNIVDVPSGDASAGKRVYAQACRGCHGDPHTGDGRISPLVSLIPDDSIAAHGTDPKSGARPVVIEKVRHGKFFSIGGNMPLFSIEALSDDELGQVLGYLESFGLPPYSM